jgi:hypothetical protein
MSAPAFAANCGRTSPQIVFEGESLDIVSMRRLRELALGHG